MNNLYDALENCLQDIEKGADTEAVLLRYPDIADELRPILQTSVKARTMSVPDLTADVLRRNRAKLLQRAAAMGAAKATPALRRLWFASLRRLAVTLAVLALVFASGTGLVRAASTTLPGDNLYPVKRTWEDVKLLFSFDAQKRESLEVEYENERLEELRELFVEGRSVKVDFAGRVARQNGNQWLVAGIPVIISPQTDLPQEPVAIGSAVRVTGLTQGNETVRADGIELLPPGASLPKGEEENNGEANPSGNEAPGSGSENEAPQVEATKTPAPAFQPTEESFDGIVESMNGDLWTINGIAADVSNAEIIGTPVIGAAVIVEGYFNSDGVFIVTKIEFVNGGSNSGNGSDSNDGGNGNSNENGNSTYNGNENENENHNENGNETENGNDHGVGNENENSGHG